MTLNAGRGEAGRCQPSPPARNRGAGRAGGKGLCVSCHAVQSARPKSTYTVFPLKRGLCVSCVRSSRLNSRSTRSLAARLQIKRFALEMPIKQSLLTSLSLPLSEWERNTPLPLFPRGEQIHPRLRLPEQTAHYTRTEIHSESSQLAEAARAELISIPNTPLSSSPCCGACFNDHPPPEAWARPGERTLTYSQK